MTDDRRTTSNASAMKPGTCLLSAAELWGAGVARDVLCAARRPGRQPRFRFGTSSRHRDCSTAAALPGPGSRGWSMRRAWRSARCIAGPAPGLPLPFLFPTYRGTPRPGSRRSARIYDGCGQRNLGPSSTLSPSQMVQKFPAVNPQGLTEALF